MITEREIFEAYIGKPIQRWIIENKSGIFNKIIDADTYIEECPFMHVDAKTARETLSILGTSRQWMEASKQSTIVLKML